MCSNKTIQEESERSNTNTDVTPQRMSGCNSKSPHQDLTSRIVASKLLGTDYDSQDDQNDDKIREEESGFEHSHHSQDEELSQKSWQRHVRVDSNYGVFYTSNRAGQQQQ